MKFKLFSRKNVALVLSSGGPRGFAYIGAIEELLARGYRITSVAGASVGSLIGGVYAAGRLEEFKQWLFSLDSTKIIPLMDFSLSKSYFIKGDKVIDTIKDIVPNVNIEELKIPYCAIATDLYTGEEIVFREGKLFDAIRASISIPSMFRPVEWEHRVLIDGGLANTFPLNRVARKRNDLLVGFNVNAVDTERINQFLLKRKAMREELLSLQEEAQGAIGDTLREEKAWSEKVMDAIRMFSDFRQEREKKEENERLLNQEAENAHLPTDAEDNYYSILDRSFSIMNHSIAKMNIALNPPDILVEMPFDAYSSIPDYGKGEAIAEEGRRLMAEALDRYEK
jgi:NTE family protein